ncbi:cytochrome P450 [Actinomadura viridis]|uniref:Cytochrome P450 n=1 Tax=Actinomadura viridis TaxID=58110 RepID=A0A931DRX2_9ACTN|nr:cytochrome P450 [Actinomadura viridis]MBG6093639.1 cytochrome P450 [Actinomadura viridis]
MTAERIPEALPLITDVRTAGPVARVTMLSGDAGYVVTRYEEAQQVLTDPAFSRAQTIRSDTPENLPRKHVGAANTLFNMDPPEHTRLRRVVSKAFTRGRVQAMREGIQTVVDGLLDRMVEAGPPVDLVEALCAPLPITEICHLLGVPYEDRAAFRGWTEAIMSISGHPFEEVKRARMALYGYLGGLVAAKRERPGDDLLSALLVLRDQEDRITESELVGLGLTLLIAGHETTMNQLGNSMHALLSRPDLYASLHRDPGLVLTAVEELLRLCPSVGVTTPRLTTRDVRVGDVLIPAGSMVAVSLIAADRDPAVFTDPETMDLARSDNRHMTFGHGPHFCLGVHLARSELQVALSSLVRRFPNLRLAVDPATVRWRTSALVRGPAELPVTW